MIVTEMLDDRLVVLEQASFDDEYTSGISYVSFDFTKKDAENILTAIRFLNNSNWDKLGQYSDADWFDCGEEEGIYADKTKLVDAEEEIDAVELVTMASGSGFMKGYMKYGGAPVFSHGVCWWPLIISTLDIENFKAEIIGVTKCSGVWEKTKVDVSIDVLTGFVTPVKYHNALKINLPELKIVYSMANGESTEAVAVSTEDGWRLDENSISLVQLRFGEMAIKYFGY